MLRYNSCSHCNGSRSLKAQGGKKHAEFEPKIAQLEILQRIVSQLILHDCPLVVLLKKKKNSNLKHFMNAKSQSKDKDMLVLRRMNKEL